ncbi:hypothetical protein DICPUDRAFT_81896 [Dictyostelium purpureum]|uniref:Ras guanine nucleotide exchange factor n=1 Tax=Dictyostelium purpureum TaxID=5786 RepID=F0ZUX1_DICPU|nr:uncharacterized protein DICPUDRAFT_81896 [Dictyostelium purpureum]EGC32248.1 hypothetical protein DICPUDRAFT_81896 [Dictyostelium purpureum]|eukprot:XP_003291215.1 hypothetical protein DICPUDRAFT_81896 [Dictyostelium purpureum]
MIQEENIEISISSIEKEQQIQLQHQPISPRTISISTSSTTSSPILSNGNAGVAKSNIENLDLSNRKISDLGFILSSYTLKFLTRLVLKNNLLTSISNEFIISTSQLLYLDISENRLLTLPETVSKWSKLQTLNLYKNNLSSIPPTIADIQTLEVLNLSNNLLKEIPNLSPISSLRRIVLDGNCFSEAVSKVYAFLYCHSIGEMDFPPPPLFSLSNTSSSSSLSTTTTTISSSSLSPSSFSNHDPRPSSKLPQQLITMGIGSPCSSPLLENKKRTPTGNSLDLVKSNFIEFPDQVRDSQKFRSIERLYLSFNIHINFDKLTPYFRCLINLKSLSMENCQLTSIPNCIFDLIFLTRLELKKNSITQIPGKIKLLTNLKRLDVSYNQLSHIDEDIINLMNLKSINFRSNKLNNDSGVACLGSMDTLKKLNLKENHLTELPSSFYLLKIKTLKLDNIQPKAYSPVKFSIDGANDDSSIESSPISPRSRLFGSKKTPPKPLPKTNKLLNQSINNSVNNSNVNIPVNNNINQQQNQTPTPLSPTMNTQQLNKKTNGLVIPPLSLKNTAGDVQNSRNRSYTLDIEHISPGRGSVDTLSNCSSEENIYEASCDNPFAQQEGEGDFHYLGRGRSQTVANKGESKTFIQTIFKQFSGSTATKKNKGSSNNLSQSTQNIPQQPQLNKIPSSNSDTNISDSLNTSSSSINGSSSSITQSGKSQYRDDNLLSNSFDSPRTLERRTSSKDEIAMSIRRGHSQNDDLYREKTFTEVNSDCISPSSSVQTPILECIESPRGQQFTSPSPTSQPPSHPPPPPPLPASPLHNKGTPDSPVVASLNASSNTSTKEPQQTQQQQKVLINFEKIKVEFIEDIYDDKGNHPIYSKRKLLGLLTNQKFQTTSALQAAKKKFKSSKKLNSPAQISSTNLLSQSQGNPSLLPTGASTFDLFSNSPATSSFTGPSSLSQSGSFLASGSASPLSVSGNGNSGNFSTYHEGDDFIRELMSSPVINQEIEFTSEDGIPKVKNVTLKMLIQLLTHERGHSNELFSLFFDTYLLFTKIPLVIEHLEQRFLNAKTHVIKQKVLSFSQRWIENCWNDFKSDDMISFNKYLQSCSDSIELITNYTLKSALKQVYSSMKLKEEGNSNEEEEIFDAPAPIPDFQLSQNANQNDICLLDSSLRPHEVARQLTIIDQDLLSQLTKQQILDYAVHQTNSPPIQKITDRFNYLVLWVCSEIVLSQSFEKRVETIFKFLNIALNCWYLKNFNSSIAIIAAMSKPSIEKLKTTWAFIKTTKANTPITEFKEMILPQNISRLRKVMDSVDSSCPVIPYLGAYFSHSIAIQNGNKSIVNEQFINMQKYDMMGKIIRSITNAQVKKYNFTQVGVLQKYLTDSPVFNEKDLHKECCKIEEKGGEAINESNKFGSIFKKK